MEGCWGGGVWVIEGGDTSTLWRRWGPDTNRPGSRRQVCRGESMTQKSAATGAGLARLLRPSSVTLHCSPD